MSAAYERACAVVQQLENENIINPEDRARARWLITEAISDALRAQVDHAKAQAPAIHIHTNPYGEGDPAETEGT